MQLPKVFQLIVKCTMHGIVAYWSVGIRSTLDTMVQCALEYDAITEPARFALVLFHLSIYDSCLDS